MAGSVARDGFLFRAWRILRRLVLWAALVLFALVLAVVAINAFDERPSAQALALNRPPENRYKPEENIYVALAGFDAPAGISVITVGQARIARYNEQVDLQLQDPLAFPTSDDKLALKFVGSTDFCRPQDSTFWTIVRANRSQVAPLTNQNHELYERYLNLFVLPGYYETDRPSPTALFVYVPTDVRNLFLANVSLGIQSADPVEVRTALENLRQDIELWHRMLVGEGAPISKLISAAYLHTDYLVLADMIADPSIPVSKDLWALLPEFDEGDWNIGKSLAAEFRVHSFMYQQILTLSDSHWMPPDSTHAERLWHRILSPIELHFFQLNATKNLYADGMNELSNVAALDPSTFSSKRARFKKWIDDNASIFSIRAVYNPIGKTLVAIVTPAYEDYVLRPYDVAGFQRLVRLSFEIRNQQIAPSAVPSFMKLHPEWSTHPADGRPFLWRPTNNEIAIQLVARQPKDRRFSVQIWRKPGG